MTAQTSLWWSKIQIKKYIQLLINVLLMESVAGLVDNASIVGIRVGRVGFGVAAMSPRLRLLCWEALDPGDITLLKALPMENFGTYVEQFRVCIRDRKESMLISSLTMYNHHDLYDDFIRFNIDTDSEQGWVDNRSSISRKINPTLLTVVNSYLLLWQCRAYCFL